MKISLNNSSFFHIIALSFLNNKMCFQLFYSHNLKSKTRLLKFRNSLFALPLLLIFIVSCGGDDPFIFEDDYSTVPEAFSTSGVTPVTTESGLTYYELETGSGEIEIGIRDAIRIYYTGRKTNDEVFDSSYKNSQTTPTTFTVADLIDGFTEGLIGMKEGGKRVLVIPPNLGYEGTSSQLRNDTLVFDIEIDTIIY